AAVRAGLRWAGLTITGAAIALAVAFDTTQLAQTPRAWAYLAVALGALAVSFVERGEEAAVTLLAAALVLAGVSAAWLLDGSALALVWAAETAVLAWAGTATRRLRLSVAAFAWLGVTLVHVLAIDAPPRTFLQPFAHPWHGIPALLGVAAAALAVVRFLPVRAELAGVRAASIVVAAGAPLLAASLAILEVAHSFDWGQVAVDGLWAAAAVAA